MQCNFLDTTGWSILSNIVLTATLFNRPNNVDMPIGAELYLGILKAIFVNFCRCQKPINRIELSNIQQQDRKDNKAYMCS